MYLTPSDAISRIEADRAKLNKRYEMLRSISQDMIALGYAQEEYMEFKPITKEKKEDLHYSLMSETTGGKYVEQCADYIKILKEFERSKRKPSEETVKSTRRKLLIDFCYMSYRMPEQTLQDLDVDKAETNQKLDELKYVCQTLTRYGVSSNDYYKAFDQYTLNYPKPKDMVRFVCFADKERIEAYDIAKYIEDSDFKPYKSWWDKHFRKEPMDATLKAMLNRLLELYVAITNK